MFRFLPKNGPIACESATAKYLFMPMTFKEEECDAESDDEKEVAPKPTPAQVRKQRTDRLRREALWLASELADRLRHIETGGSDSSLSQVRVQLQKVADCQAALSTKRCKFLTVEELRPPQVEPNWEEIGDFARADGTIVTLVRSDDGFFSIRNEEETNLTSSDVADLFEPILSQVWKPCTLALYYNGQPWWVSAEHQITRKGKKAQRSLILGEARPASSAFMGWEKSILERLLSDHADSIPAGSMERIKTRVEEITRISDQPAPEPLDLLPLCLAFPATA